MPAAEGRGHTWYTRGMTQAQALTILKTGANVFLTGEPGSGKTHTLNDYVTYLREHGIDVAITASTGIAATHIGGMTIHAWSGIGIKDSLSPYDIEQIATRERVAKRIARAKVLVIDEVSMLDARVFGMVDQVVRAVRKRDEPFGGMQVVLVGDFFQLPPIGARGSEVQFAFRAPLWRELGLIVCYLEEQHRQGDDALHGLLSSLRRGDIDEGIYEVLESCKETAFEDGIEPTRLYTHNADVDRINVERLNALSGSARVFAMEGKGAKPLVEGLKKSCLSPETLSLKVGAMVMCTKNNFEVGYVNGTLGQVVKYDATTGYPVIATLEGEELTITPASWSVADGDSVLAEVTQVPLRLAWAITVHKSQGMSLDAAEMDLSNAFEYGQGYVALSRVRALSGLLLRGCNERALEVHPSVRAEDAVFKERSEEAVDTFEALSAEEIQSMHERFIRASGGTLEAKPVTRKPSMKDETSTYEKTKLLLAGRKTIEEIAAARQLSTGTICEHLERLARDGAISAADIRHLVPKSATAKRKHAAIVKALEEVGDAALKPVFERLKGVYSYDEIRRARILHLLAS